MTMQQASVQVVSVALAQCKLHTILNRMVKAAQLTLGGFLCLKYYLYSSFEIYVIIMDEKKMKFSHFLYYKRLIHWLLTISFT